MADNHDVVEAIILRGNDVEKFVHTGVIKLGFTLQEVERIGNLFGDYVRSAGLLMISDGRMPATFSRFPMIGASRSPRLLSGRS